MKFIQYLRILLPSLFVRIVELVSHARLAEPEPDIMNLIVAAQELVLLGEEDLGCWRNKPSLRYATLWQNRMNFKLYGDQGPLLLHCVLWPKKRHWLHYVNLWCRRPPLYYERVPRIKACGATHNQQTRLPKRR